MNTGEYRRLYVWAESPEQRQLVKQRLQGGPWIILPVFQQAEGLVKLLTDGPADGIILDSTGKIPEVVKNLELLEEQCPGCARIVVASGKEQETFRNWKGLAPMLLKPEMGEAMWKELITRAVAINGWFLKPEIRYMLPRLRAIPTLPSAHRRVVEELQDPNYRVDQVAALIVPDVTLTAHLLKVVNSAAFSPSQPIHSVPSAVAMVGKTRLQALVMSAWAFFFMNERSCPGFSPEAEWTHARNVAQATQPLAREKHPADQLVEEAFTAGLLHDIGKIALAANEPVAYGMILKEARNSGRPAYEVEKDNLGFTHAEMGACLLAVWGMPLPIVEGVACHHDASFPASGSIAGIVHQADEEVRGAEKAAKPA